MLLLCKQTFQSILFYILLKIIPILFLQLQFFKVMSLKPKYFLIPSKPCSSAFPKSKPFKLKFKKFDSKMKL